MSKGYGATQRKILTLFEDPNTVLHTSEVCKTIYGKDTKAARVSTLRALGKLPELTSHGKPKFYLLWFRGNSETAWLKAWEMYYEPRKEPKEPRRLREFKAPYAVRAFKAASEDERRAIWQEFHDSEDYLQYHPKPTEPTSAEKAIAFCRQIRKLYKERIERIEHAEYMRERVNAKDDLSWWVERGYKIPDVSVPDFTEAQIEEIEANSAFFEREKWWE